jgi:hypothetical protein
LLGALDEPLAQSAVRLVSTRVSNVKNNDPSLIEPIAAA